MALRDPITGLTPQHEVFAGHLAAGKSQAEAYRLAYPNARNWKDESLWPKASALAADGKVLARISGLRAVATKEIIYNVQEAMREAHAAFQMAVETRNAGHMVRAVELKSKLKGLLIERSETGRPGEFSHLSEAEIDAQIAATEAIIRASNAGKVAGKKRKTMG